MSKVITPPVYSLTEYIKVLPVSMSYNHTSYVPVTLYISIDFTMRTSGEILPSLSPFLSITKNNDAWAILEKKEYTEIASSSSWMLVTIKFKYFVHRYQYNIVTKLFEKSKYVGN